MNKTKIDRRALLGGLTAALVAPRYSFAASITDATGRTVTAPDRLMRIYRAGPPAAVELYTLAPDLLMGVAGTDRTRGTRIPPSRVRRTAENSAAHRAATATTPISARSLRSSPISSSTLAMSTQRIRRSPNASSSRAAFPTCCSTGAPRPHRRDLSRARPPHRPQRTGRNAGAPRRNHDRDDHAAQRRSAERRAPPCLLRPRQERAANRLRRLDDQ